MDHGRPVGVMKVPVKLAEESPKAVGDGHDASSVAKMPCRSIRFASFTLDLDRLSLNGPSGQVGLRPKSFEVLRYLVEHAGRVASKEELLKAVWPDVIVTDDSLTVCIGEVRRALGDANQQIVKTVPKRGYLFDVSISVCDALHQHVATTKHSIAV